MYKKLATVVTIIVLLLLLSPVYAQEETPPSKTPIPQDAAPTEEVQPTPEETPTPQDIAPTEEVQPSQEDTFTPQNIVPTEEAQPSQEETPAPEGETLTETRPSSEDFLVDISLPDEFDCNLDVIVQRDDWLSKLAEKFYGNILAFPVIFATTNAKFTEDNTYVFIEDPDLIEPGWKVCIVGVDVAEQILGFELESAPLADDTPQNLDGIIKVGGAHALTGPLEKQAQFIRNGIDMAVQEINAGTLLGGGALEIIWEDTGANSQQATKAFNKLINEDEVVAIVGPTLSRSAFSAASLAQTAGVPVIGSSNTADGITGIGDNIFRTNLPQQVIIRNTVQRAKELLNLEKVAMIYDNNNAFTTLSHNAFTQILAEEEIEVVTIEPFTHGQTDPSDQLSNIQILNPDAIILNALGADAANIILLARRLGVSDNIRFIGAGSFDSSPFFDAGGTVINGTVAGAAWSINTNSGSNRKFVTDYEALYGRPPDQLAAQSYTAIWALATALHNADSTDHSAIRNALDDIDLIESPLGLFTFDDNRNPDHSAVIQVVDDGAFVVFQ